MIKSGQNPALLMEDPKKFLSGVLLERKLKNPRYSVSALSRDLELSQPFVCQLLNGKRNLSLEQKSHIAVKFGFNIFESQEASQKTSAQIRLTQRTIENEKILRHWYHFAILEMLAMGPVKMNPARIAKRFRITFHEVMDAINRLIEFGYVEENQKNEWVRTCAPIIIFDQSYNSCMADLHRSRLAAAVEELERNGSRDVEERIFQTLFLPTSRKKIFEAKIKLAQFQKEMIEFLKSGTNDEICQFSLQIFSVEKDVE